MDNIETFRTISGYTCRVDFLEDGMRMRALALLLAGVATLAQAGTFGNMVGALAGRSSGPSDDRSIDAALENLSAHMNRKVPMLVDPETRLDRVSAESGHKLSYHYTLTSVPRSMSATEFTRLVRPALQQRLCASSEMQAFLKHGVTISYVYRDVSGKPLGSTQFKPSDCGYPQA
jgi:hypothetical protein